MTLGIDMENEFPKRGGIYGFRWLADKWWEYRALRFMAKQLKGGYYVIHDGRNRQISRGALRVGWLSIKEMEGAAISQKYEAIVIDFFNKDNVLVFRTTV